MHVGIVGVTLVWFFVEEDGVIFAGGSSTPWKGLGINILGALTISAWSLVWYGYKL